MRFDLIDRILERSPDRIVTLKGITAAEEYLQDHFPTFPVLPGVMMLEAMVQAGRLLAEPHHTDPLRPLVLGRVRALKYGRFVKPGSALRVEVTFAKPPAAGEFDLTGEALVVEPGAPTGERLVAASGRFTLRPFRPGPVPVGEPASAS